MNTASSKMDQFGFYQVGTEKFYSRLEAAELKESTGLPMTWNFNELKMSAQQWDVEPTETLEELYRQRAQQLRDQYDYLVLWFSGGADSTNILDSFVNNDIRLDEVASYVNYEATGDLYNALNGEVYNVAVPKIQEVRLKQPDIKHTLVDLARITIEHFTAKETKFDWIYHMNGYMNPNNASKGDTKLYNPEWRRMINEGKRVGFIHGIDKPRVNGLNGKYYYRFVDLIDQAVNANTQIMNRPWEFDELFYWTPNMPQLVIKQAHVLKRFLKQATPDTPYMTLQPMGLVSKTIGTNMYWVTLDGVNSLIYPNWKPVLYQGKPRSLIFSPRDEWFFKLPDSDPAKIAWRTGLEHIWRTMPDSVKKNPKSLADGFKIFSSKVYDLGT